MKQPIIYLQTGFWENLSANHSRDGVKTKLNISDSMAYSCVITDATEEMVIKDVYLKTIIKQKSYKRCDEHYIEKKIANLETSEDLCATFLMGKSSVECQNIECKFGVLVLNDRTAIEKQYFFEGDGFSFEKNVRYSERYLTYKDKLSHPCNSLIVIDPYILNGKREVITDESGKKIISYPDIKNNLEPLLDAILPKSLNIDFHLTIISRTAEIDELKLVYEKVKKCLKRIRNDLNVRLGLFYTDQGFIDNKETFHSRHIISNNFIIDSEDGFNLFNKYGYVNRNNPSITIVFPNLFGNSRQDMSKYSNWISSVKKYIEEDVGNRCEGSKDNRLFYLTD